MIFSVPEYRLQTCGSVSTGPEPLLYADSRRTASGIFKDFLGSGPILLFACLSV